MSDQAEVLSHIRSLIEGHKREIKIQYAEMKIRLPAYLKSITIKELREAGATVDPSISFPRGAPDRVRKQALVNRKIEEVREKFTTQVKEYYENIKRNLPQEMLNKRIGDLSLEEMDQLDLKQPR